MHLRSCWYRGGVAAQGVALLTWLTLTAASGALAPAHAAAADAADHPGDETTPQRIMPLDEIERGMRGYGVTVFQGTEPEPFSVEVLSVAHNYGPQRSVIWIHSEDPRMLESGPVQGMSGSPIYLWDQGEAGEPGEGGRLIGAFAYGFAMAKGCIVGVQPIEYMLDVGGRANETDESPEAGDADELGATNEGGEVAAAKRTLGQLARRANRHEGGPRAAAPRLDALRALLEPAALEREQGADGEPGRTVRVPRVPETAPASKALPSPPADYRQAGEVMPMLLPMSLGSGELAELARPLLEPMGIHPVAAGGGGQAPAANAVGDQAEPNGAGAAAEEAPPFEPGGVLAVPLAFGDLDLSASGTVTDVLPDGTVLGLGHAMFGEGPVALPMASGYVHFIVPRLDISFKLSGSGAVHGSLVRDELTGVAGRRDVERFKTSPVNVSVQMPDRAPREYSYEVVDHPQLTPTLAAIVTLRSIEAEHQPPRDSTLSLRGQMRFNSGHTVELDTMMPGEQMFMAMSELLPPLSLAMQNPHEALELESMDVSVEVTPQRRTATIINAQLDRAEVAPGESVGVTLWVQPYKQEPRRLRTELTIPTHVPEGDYPLLISDANTYLSQLMALRPHLFTTRNVDDLMHMIQRIMSVRTNAVHLTMRLPEEGIAVGRQELSQLPTSRRAMIFTPTSTVAQPFMEMLEHTLETDLSIEGQVGFTVHVREERTQTQPPPGQRSR